MSLGRTGGQVISNKHRDEYFGWWLSPGIGVAVCKTCGALVDPDYVIEHSKFHPAVSNIAARLLDAEEEIADRGLEIDHWKKEAAAFRQTAETLQKECAELTHKLNTPEILDYMRAVPLEAAHQRERWGSEHDAGKTPADWFWLVGYLAGKALASHIAGNTEKALHHTISTSATLANWHMAILGKTDMRPGIAEPTEGRSDAISQDV